MPLTLNEELRRTFALAALRKEAGHIRTPRQWNRANTLMERCRTLRERENRQFIKYFDTRVEAARLRIIDRAASPKDELKPDWARNDTLSPAQTLRQAGREVQAGHIARLVKINHAELRELGNLVQRSAVENSLKGNLVIDFARASKERAHSDGPQKSGPSRD